MGFQADRFDPKVSRRILPQSQLLVFSIVTRTLRVLVGSKIAERFSNGLRGRSNGPILRRVIVIRAFSEGTLSAEVAVYDIERGVDIRLVPADPNSGFVQRNVACSGRVLRSPHQ